MLTATRAGYRFRCPDLIALDSIQISIFFITFSEYSFNTKSIDISNISLQMVN